MCGIAVVDTSAHPVTAAVPVGDITPSAGTPVPPSSSPSPPEGWPHDEVVTTTLTVVEQTAYTADPSTTEWPSLGNLARAAEPFEPLDRPPFRLTVLMTLATLAALAAVASAFTDVATFRLDGGQGTGSGVQSAVFRLNSFSSSNLVAVAIGAALLLFGSLFGALGRRVGAGAAGGAGLALAGVSVTVVGQVLHLFDGVEVRALQSGNPYTLTTTYELGFYLIVAAGGLGVLAFFASLGDLRPDGLVSPNPAFAIIGPTAGLLLVGSMLVPMNGAEFVRQFTDQLVPPITLQLRLVVLVLLALGTFVGFVTQRRWGIGVALGSISIGIWQTVAAAVGVGDRPFAVAGGNLGSTGSVLLFPSAVLDDGTALRDFAPHIITTAGFGVVLVCVIGAWISSVRQNSN